MIYSVRCDQRSFRDVRFNPAFNVILADRTKEATRRDSRNGLGKSTLVEIIHFCLGANLKKGQGLGAEPLHNWTFTLELDVGDSVVAVSRNTANPKVVFLEGDVNRWPINPNWDAKNRCQYLSVRDWVSVLGHFMFGPMVNAAEDTYQPTFRSLISYFVRRGRDAYSTPFEHFRKQAEWDKQVNTAFLLDLAWQDASDWQRLRDRQAALDILRKAWKAGLLRDMLGSPGELEAERVRLQAQIDQNQHGLDSFNVHPQYRVLEQDATRLTRELHDLTNAKIVDRRNLEYCEASLNEERDTAAAAVTRVYAEARVIFPEVVTRRLEEVHNFHKTVVENRRKFLKQEIERLKRRIARKDFQVGRKTEQRADLMRALQSHGPWEEYTELQQQQAEAIGRLESLDQQIERVRKFEEGRSSLRIDKELLWTRARQDYAERSIQRQRAVRIFNENSERLYAAPGNLVIDVTDRGYKFNIEIQRSGSGGVGNMKVFCYDLMIAELWADKTTSPGFLIHDSIVFDGVDERQIANALVLAAEKSAEFGFQYICALNSDTVPWVELEGALDLNSYVRLRLTDEMPGGSLLGIRY